MNLVSRAPQAENERGFTIIELLVAVAVTALMVTLMLTIVINVMQGWDRSSGTISAGNQARLVLDQITRDLQSAIIRRDGNVWLAAGVQRDQSGANGGKGWANHPDPKAAWSPAKNPNDSLVIPDTFATVATPVAPSALPAIEDYRFGQGGIWLRFFSNVSDQYTAGSLQTLSAPRAVAYQILRVPTVSGGSEIRYQLFRSEVRPGHATLPSTFSVGYNLFSSTSAYNVATATNYGMKPAESDGGAPGSIRRPDFPQLIANNVVDFGVRFLKYNALGQVQVLFPQSTTRLGFAATTDTTAQLEITTNMSYGFPDVAEVFVRILTDAGVSRISNLEEGNITGDWWTMALADSKVFVRRIDLKSGQSF